MKRFVWLLVAAVLLLSGCGNKEEKYTAYCEQGTASLSQQEYEQALEIFGKAADLLPDRPEAYQGRAEVYLAMAEAAEEGSEEQTSAYASALAEYEAAIQRDSGNAELYQKAIELCRQMGEEDKLLALLQSGAEATGDRTLKEALETERSRTGGCRSALRHAVLRGHQQVPDDSGSGGPSGFADRPWTPG